MARLIDPDKLKKLMCFKCNDEYSDEPCEPLDCVFRNAINDAPTEDAVKVVRCRDCKYWDKDTFSCGWDSENYYWNQEDYCSYGERKDGDNNGG